MKLADLAEIGIVARLNDAGSLVLDAPAGILQGELLDRLRAAKPALVAEIQRSVNFGEDGEHAASMFTHGGKGCAVPQDLHAACSECHHMRRPGLSGGYCAGGRADLVPAYGANHPLRRLPADGGTDCKSFRPAKWAMRQH